MTRATANFMGGEYISQIAASNGAAIFYLKNGCGAKLLSILYDGRNTEQMHTRGN
jgi:hypothetical protein